MLHTSIVSDTDLVGFGEFGGSAAIQNLQQALVNLSMTGWPAVHPGPVTGEVTPQTVAALGQVIAQLGGLSATQKGLLQVALASAMISTQAMATAKELIASQAVTLQLAIIAYTAKRAGSNPPPAPASTGTPAPKFMVFQTMQKASTSPSLPAGSLQAKTARGTYRVAVPKSFTSGLGGASLGESLVELPSRSGPSTGATLVTEKDLDNALKPPFYKRPLYWAALGGGLALAGGAYWMIRR